MTEEAIVLKQIIFKENQNTIKIGKNKICKSRYNNYIEFHII